MKILLVCGPQGSGNHLWSKVLSTWADGHPAHKYWVGHKHEPHSSLWENVDSWNDHSFPDVNTVISVSIPFAVNGNTRFPDIKRWKEIMTERGLPHEIAVITRDKSINYYQNERVRPVNNYINSIQYINELDIDAFFSTETLILYKQKYLDQLNKQLEFPIECSESRLQNILGQSFNEKYVKYVHDFPLDLEVRSVSGYAD